VITKQLRLAVAIKKEILPPVVVEVAPHGAHRDASFAAVDVCKTNRWRDVFECAITLVAIQPVEASFTAVGDVEILPPVAVAIRNRHCRSHGCYLRHDVFESGVEGRSFVDEVDASLLGGFHEPESEAHAGGSFVI